VDSVTLARTGDSTFLASTLVGFADTLSAESGERFDREVDVQELACGQARIRNIKSSLMLGDSMVAMLPQGAEWRPVQDREVGLFDARCAFLLASFVMRRPPIFDVATVEQRPRLANAGAVITVINQAYPEIARQGFRELTVVVSFIIDEQGTPDRSTLEVVTSELPMAGQIIERVISRMRFRPARVDGHAVRVRIQMPITFVPHTADAPPLDVP